MNRGDERATGSRLRSRTLIQKRLDRERWAGLGVIGWLMTVAASVPAATIFFRLSDFGMSMLIVGGIFAAFYPIRVWLYLSHRRRRLLAECDCQRCLYCFQDLRGIGQAGTCPECGTGFEISGVQAAWRAEFFKGYTGTRKNAGRRISIAIGAVFLLTVVPLFMRFLNGQFGAVDIALTGMVFAGIGYSVYESGRTKRHLAKLAACDYRCCVKCEFDLRGLPNHGQCPECGEPYEIEEVRQWWKESTISV